MEQGFPEHGKLSFFSLLRPFLTEVVEKILSDHLDIDDTLQDIEVTNNFGLVREGLKKSVKFHFGFWIFFWIFNCENTHFPLLRGGGSDLKVEFSTLFFLFFYPSLREGLKKSV